MVIISLFDSLEGLRTNPSLGALIKRGSVSSLLYLFLLRSVGNPLIYGRCCTVLEY